MSAELEQSDMSAWTPEELAAIRAGLEGAVVRLEAEMAVVNGDITGSSSAGGVEVLHDELDVASQRAELLQDAVQAQNLATILQQTQHVIGRLSEGQYGVCESCSGPIGRPRLEAFPRATVCMSCAH
jgi:DnaK suppressor protein